MYQVTWLVRNKVIFVRCEGVVTSQELKSGASIMHAMLVGITEPVHCIVDSRELEKFPMSISPAMYLMRQQEYSGWTINISRNLLKRGIAKIVNPLFTNGNLKTVPTLSTAFDFLQYEDQQLPNLVEHYNQKHLVLA